VRVLESQAQQFQERGSRRPSRRRRSRRRRKPRESGPVETAALRLGIRQLHAEQERAIADILAGRDVLMVLPTGFGKSACYQIPSMVLPQPVVVISPLIALLRDQSEKLTRFGVPCVRLDGTIRGKARREALERIAAGGSLLIMTTPETLAMEATGEILRQSGIGLAAIDEAHCISEWGFDFRPSYQRIGARLRELGGPPLLALTATATTRVRTAIIDSLRMREPQIVASSPHRSNLAFEVLRCEGAIRPRVLLRLVKRLRRPGIVYCATRAEVDGVYTLLRRFRIPAHRYHGGMTPAERDAEQQEYMRPKHRSVMVATNAFGLGIDKPDIRFILHYQAPASLEQYVQEAGRSGRDGNKANCILLDDPADRSIHEALLARSRVRPDQLYKLGRALAAWAGENRDPTVQALAVSAQLGPRITSALLTTVEEAGLVLREKTCVRLLAPHDTIEEQTRGLAGQFQTLRTQDARRLDALAEYASSTDCRAGFLRRYFGEDEGEPCRLCDVCRGLPERPTGFFAPIARPEPPRRPRRRGRRRGRSRGNSN